MFALCLPYVCPAAHVSVRAPLLASYAHQRSFSADDLSPSSTSEHESWQLDAGAQHGMPVTSKSPHSPVYGGREGPSHCRTRWRWSDVTMRCYKKSIAPSPSRLSQNAMIHLGHRTSHLSTIAKNGYRHAALNHVT